jgi:hypothetical protein
LTSTIALQVMQDTASAARRPEVERRSLPARSAHALVMSSTIQMLEAGSAAGPG